MPILGELDPTAATDSVEVGFKRHFWIPALAMAALEIVVVVLPLWTLFDLGELDPAMLFRIVIPVLAGMTLLWFVAVAALFAPIQRAIQARRRGKRLPAEISAKAYDTTWRMPLKALYLRTAMWVAATVALGVFLSRHTDWPEHKAVEMASLAAMHAFVVGLCRAAWHTAILRVVRAQLFPGRSSIELFADGYRGQLTLVSHISCGGAVVAFSAVLYYLLPISLEQYLQIQTYFPTAVAVGLLAWVLVAGRFAQPLQAYLDAHLEGARGDVVPTPAACYRRAQSLPYRLALTSLATWTVVVIGAVLVARGRLRFELDNTILMVVVAVVIAVGAAIYESLWHRETMRALLAHLTMRHRLPVRALKPALSLRVKLLLSFGGVVLFACGMALFWGFVQYKNLVTDFVARQAELGLAWLRSEVQGASVAQAEAPGPELVRTVLRSVDERSSEPNTVFYYMPNQPGQAITVLGAGPRGVAPPPLPWYAKALMARTADGALDLSASLGMSGRHGRLVVNWRGERYDLGAVAVLYPDYRSGGPEATVQPLSELLIFFVVLFGACAGIVTMTVSQFVKPIRMLERRADGMARGELAEPVSSGGEGDEIGRLTFALEEMRRALRDKLRSTEEINLDLERAVQRRTADLAKKNRELAETLDKLTRAQDQLVRSEKMASIGQLVAGIAHEINNPVNAIVNTVSPLEETLPSISSRDPEERKEAMSDAQDMIRVIRRGAERTKAIVQALHNYSRTDDENLVDFDLNRGLDDSLELLRHVLKQNITVERDFGDVGKIRAHAGQLNQVFMNLLTNAAQALSGRENAVIRIETARAEDQVSIRITDNGEGIPPEVLPRIFDPFFTTKDVGEGTGLGLSIVHGLVERHGGVIEVESQPAVGTTFTVRLPRSPEHARSITGGAVGMR